MVARTLLKVTSYVLYTACLVLYISYLLLLFFLRLNNNYPSNLKIQMAVGYNTEVKTVNLCLYNQLFALYHYVFKFLTP